MSQLHPSEHRSQVKADTLCFWNGAGRKSNKEGENTFENLYLLKKIKIIGNQK